MELIRKSKNGWDPIDLLEDFHYDLDRWFNKSMLPQRTAGADFLPAMEIHEEEDHYSLKADLPGLRKEDVKITVQENRITVSGERRQEKQAKEKGYSYSERRYGSFVRTFELPTEVIAEKAKAEFKDGVLTIELPKSEKAKPKQINVDVK